MRVLNLGSDPSLAYRPDCLQKDKEEFRNFESGELFDRVFNTYKLMHTHQTLDFVKKKHLEWANCTHFSMTMMDSINSLDALVDESDPDVDFPNSFHAFQTAEGIRKEHPDKDWFQLVGLIHDIGKIMALYGEPQWAVVGDTFPVGCKFQNSIVFRNSTFEDNPDEKNLALNTEFGIYKAHCGLDNVLMSWGHDEYLYRVLKFNKCTIPEEVKTQKARNTAFHSRSRSRFLLTPAIKIPTNTLLFRQGLNMIRFHSFYPWHSNGDYMHLCNEKDLQMLTWVKEFK
ncbi:inositol oxygenase isoform X2 [Triplophysa dalaica]|uniref:inositol oxygenase isoform X2 n=1 Tax=Triplophysa dalaica TaxID=1582913 RepID=UPI0024DF586E|nr:inositol oxygenase isoform X2 [Triplophysa dalaica]